MTRSEFAYAVRADEKWVENAAMLLGKRFSYTFEEAVWLGLLRELVSELGLTLAKAAEVADEALGRDSDERRATAGELSFVSIVADLPRSYSTYAVSASAARTFAAPKRRGRRRPIAKSRKAALANAAAYGVDLDLLREGLELSPRERLERLDQNAAFLAAIRPSTRNRKRK